MNLLHSNTGERHRDNTFAITSQACARNGHHRVVLPKVGLHRCNNTGLHVRETSLLRDHGTSIRQQDNIAVLGTAFGRDDFDGTVLLRHNLLDFNTRQRQFDNLFPAAKHALARQADPRSVRAKVGLGRRHNTRGQRLPGLAGNQVRPAVRQDGDVTNTDGRRALDNNRDGHHGGLELGVIVRLHHVFSVDNVRLVVTEHDCFHLVATAELDARDHDARAKLPSRGRHRFDFRR